MIKLPETLVITDIGDMTVDDTKKFYSSDSYIRKLHEYGGSFRIITGWGPNVVLPIIQETDVDMAISNGMILSGEEAKVGRRVDYTYKDKIIEFIKYNENNVLMPQNNGKIGDITLLGFYVNPPFHIKRRLTRNVSEPMEIKEKHEQTKEDGFIVKEDDLYELSTILSETGEFFPFSVEKVDEREYEVKLNPEQKKAFNFDDVKRICDKMKFGTPEYDSYIGINNAEKDEFAEEILGDNYKNVFYIASGSASERNLIKKLKELRNDIKILAPKGTNFDDYVTKTMYLRQGYPYFMLKEIFEQPDAIRRTVAKQDREKIEKISEKILNSDVVYLVGSGSSDFLGIYGDMLLSNQGIKSKSIPASAFRSYLNTIDKDSSIIFSSQSGETYDSLTTFHLMRERPYILSITNSPNSTLARKSDDVLFTHSGREVAVATTKFFTSELSLLHLLSSSIDGNIEREKEVLTRVSKDLEKNIDQFDSLARNIVKNDIRDTFVIGKGLSYPLALESALKMKEIGYIHSEGFESGQLKHGPLALIEDGTPCIALAMKDENYKYTLINAEEVISRGGEVIGITPENEDIFKHHFKIPNYEEARIISVVPSQLIAYHTAIKKGYSPDEPRNLAKSVTVA